MAATHIYARLGTNIVNTKSYTSRHGVETSRVAATAARGGTFAVVFNGEYEYKVTFLKAGLRFTGGATTEKTRAKHAALIIDWLHRELPEVLPSNDKRGYLSPEKKTKGPKAPSMKRTGEKVPVFLGRMTDGWTYKVKEMALYLAPDGTRLVRKEVYDRGLRGIRSAYYSLSEKKGKSGGYSLSRKPYIVPSSHVETNAEETKLRNALKASGLSADVLARVLGCNAKRVHELLKG